MAHKGPARALTDDAKRLSTAGAPLEDAERLLRLARHRWFGGRFPADGELAVARLLLGVYVASARDRAIHKKAAAAVMGVEDVRTARKYVALAEQQGLLKSVPASDDRRKELLQPTALLDELVSRERTTLADTLAAAAEAAAGDETVAIRVTRSEAASHYAEVAQRLIYRTPTDDEGINEYIDTALKLDPRCWQAHIVRARLFEKLDLLEQAVAEYERAFSISPEFREGGLGDAMDRLRAKLNEKNEKEGA